MKTLSATPERHPTAFDRTSTHASPRIVHAPPSNSVSNARGAQHAHLHEPSACATYRRCRRRASFRVAKHAACTKVTSRWHAEGYAHGAGRSTSSPRREAAARCERSDGSNALLPPSRAGAPRAERRQRLGRCKPAQRLLNDAPMGLARRYKLLPSDCRAAARNRIAELRQEWCDGAGPPACLFTDIAAPHGAGAAELRASQPVPLRRILPPCRKRVCHCTVTVGNAGKQPALRARRTDPP